jgi:hypothetical protein
MGVHAKTLLAFPLCTSSLRPVACCLTSYRRRLAKAQSTTTPARGRGALSAVVPDVVDVRARYGVLDPGGLEAGAGELVAGCIYQQVRALLVLGLLHFSDGLQRIGA